MYIISGTCVHPNSYSLVESYKKTDAKFFWSFLPPQSIFPTQFLFKIDAHPIWSFLPPQYIFLIQVVFKTDANPVSSGFCV